MPPKPKGGLVAKNDDPPAMIFSPRRIGILFHEPEMSKNVCDMDKGVSVHR